MYQKFRYSNTDIHVYIQEPTDQIRLLQHNALNVLSLLRNGEEIPNAVINCSYFTSEYVLGRNQGDLKNDTHDQEGFYDLVFDDDGYHLGSFKSYEYTDDVYAGFSVGSVLIQDGEDVALISSAIVDESKITSINPQSAIGVLEDGRILLIVSDGRTLSNIGISGNQLRTFIKSQYPTIKLLCQLDGGGSSEMIVNGTIKNKPSDGSERSMWNGLAFIDIPKEFVTVNYDTVGGGKLPSSSVKIGEKYILLKPTKENFYFDGWYYESTYDTYVGIENDTLDILESMYPSITLYAKWSEQEVYPVTPTGSHCYLC